MLKKYTYCLIFLAITLIILLLPYEQYSGDYYPDYRRLLLTFFSILSLFTVIPKLYKVFLLPFIIIWLFQFLSYFSTGEYVNPLVIENLGHFSDLGKTELFKFLTISCVVLSLFIILFFTDFSFKGQKYLSAVLLILFSITLFKKSYPIYNFYNTCKYVYYVNFGEIESYDGKIFAKNFRASDLRSVFFNKSNESTKPNIIVFFIEGMSNRVISEKLTPNLFNLQKKSLVFDNYYNHTAATYRGIRGQLISGYQKTGGSYKWQIGVASMNKKQLKRFYDNPNIESLPKILNNNNYDSIFIAGHGCDANLFSLMEIVGFKKIKGKCDYIGSASNLSYLSDKESFELLKHTIIEEKNSKTPFFIAFYNLETHHGMDVKEHVFDNSDNEYYNKFFNLDYYLGNFIRWLDKENNLENTLLIVTTDHSTYSVNEFENSYSYKSVSRSRFVDKIPLIMYSKNIIPSRIDVEGRNSLAFTPTILDLLGYDNISNHFLGNSLFNNKHSFWENVSIVNDVFVWTGGRMAHDIFKIDKKHLDELDLYYRFAR